MEELDKLWKKIEKWAVYSALFIYLTLELLAVFIPAVSQFIDAKGRFILIAVILLIIFRFLDERLDTPKTDFELAHAGDFVKSVVELLRQNKEIKTIEILAHNATLYYTALRESKVKIGNLRLLLHDPKELISFQANSQESALEPAKHHAAVHARYFTDMQKDGLISKLFISYYPFDPTFHFMIVNSKYLFFGIYQQEDDYPGTNIMNCFIIDSSSRSGAHLLKDHQTQFEKLWKIYPISISK